MDNFQKSIIHTIAFYDAVGEIPLTNVELYKYLITPPHSARASGEPDAKNPPPASFGDFLKLLSDEWRGLNPYVSRYRGFYFLKKNKGAYQKRIQAGKTSIKKWRIAKNMAKLISFLPYVRMIAITGSLAQHATKTSSDIDVLIVAKGGRIWTTRVLVSALMHILGKRRHGKKIKDRICLNHYISDSHPLLRPQHLFSAHIYTSFIPLWSKNQTLGKFLEKNKKCAKAYLCRPHTEKKYAKTIGQAQSIARAVPAVIEYILTKIGADNLEKILKTLQLAKIRRNIEGGQTKTADIIFEDRALVFHHPRPVKQKALLLYKETLKEMDSRLF